MFFRLGILFFILASMPTLVIAGGMGTGTGTGDPRYDEFGNRVESKNDDSEALESETEPPPPEPDYQKMFDATIGGGFGYGFPVGSFYDGFDSGPLYFGEIRIAFSPKTYVKLGYRRMNIFQDTQGVSDVDGTYLGTVDLSVDVDVYTASIGWLSLPNKFNKLRIYGEVGGGYANHVITASFDSLTISEGDGK